MGEGAQSTADPGKKVCYTTEVDPASKEIVQLWQVAKIGEEGKEVFLLVKREGRRLEEGKVSHFSKTLRKHHAKWEEGAIQRRRELKRAEMYLKWAHRMIKDHRW